MLRDAERDLKKMSKALRRDVEQPEKDLEKTPSRTPAEPQPPQRRARAG